LLLTNKGCVLESHCFDLYFCSGRKVSGSQLPNMGRNVYYESKIGFQKTKIYIFKSDIFKSELILSTENRIYNQGVVYLTKTFFRDVQNIMF
jgi:hypothetical protein